MASPYMTAKQAAEYLCMPISTFSEKRAALGLIPIQIYPGRKGKRYKRSEVEAIARRAEQTRDKAVRKVRETIAKATGGMPLPLAG